MRNVDGRGIALQRDLDDFARVHAGTIDGAAEQLLELNQSMARVQEQTALIIYWIAI